MSLQAELLDRLMQQDGIKTTFLATNLSFPKPAQFFEKLRGLRACLRCVLFSWRLWKTPRRIQVVHILACSGLYFFLVVCPAICISRIQGRRVILNYHGGLADRFLRRYRYLTQPFFRMADVVTAPSKFLVDAIMLRTGVSVQLIPNVVDHICFRYRHRKPVIPRMLVTRHLEKLYDVESVLRAFQEVQKRYPDASLQIAGTGSQEGYLRRLAESLNLKNVIFLGHVPHQDLPALYDQCDILLNASRADNFPGSLIEAAAAGLVVVSTGVGGIPHIFEQGKSALLVAPGDWAGLAAGVFRVIESPELASALTQNALQQSRTYDWKKVRPMLYSAYGFGMPNSEFVPAGVGAASVETGSQ